MPSYPEKCPRTAFPGTCPGCLDWRVSSTSLRALKCRVCCYCACWEAEISAFLSLKGRLAIPLSLRKTDPWKGLAWKGLTPWKLCLETLGDCYVYTLAISVRDKLFSHPLKYLVVYLLFVLKIDRGYIFLTQSSH